jgi:hypothetical protein
MVFGVALAAAIVGSTLLLGKYVPSFGDGSKPRERRLGWLRDFAVLVSFLALIPVLGTMHGGDHVYDRGRHFSFVCLLVALGLVGLAAVIGSIWWVVAGILVAREQSLD